MRHASQSVKFELPNRQGYTNYLGSFVHTLEKWHPATRLQPRIRGVSPPPPTPEAALLLDPELDKALGRVRNRNGDRG